MSLVFGAAGEAVPHPEIDWKGFEAALTALNAAQGPIWCPLRSRERPWFSMNKLRRKFGHGIFGGKQCTIS